MSKALDGLNTAFAGESMARNKYMAFAKKAEEEGYPQVARLFRAAAEAEFVHAQNHFRAMGEVKSTAENLQAAVGGENYEVVTMYPPFMADALAEGNKKAEITFKWAWEVEKVHEELYRGALESLGQGDEAFDYYVCPVCGYTHPRNAPDKCPICGTLGSKFNQIK
jgi:rubrerythrin